MSIQDIINSGANVTIAIGVDDLKEFARTIVEKARQDLAQDIAKGQNEVYYTIDRVASILDVDKSTLWRWSKKKYLVPIKVGGLTRYRKSDIDKILNYRQ